MSHLSAYLLLLTLSPLLVLVIHSPAIRIFGCGKSFSPQLAVGLSILIGYGVIALFAWIFHLRYLGAGNLFWAVFYSFIVYTCLAYSYFHFFNISETARRFQILVVLNSYGRVYRRDLALKYNVANMIKVRLERLIQIGQLSRENDRYFLKRYTLCYIAQILMAWAVLLKFLGDKKK